MSLVVALSTSAPAQAEKLAEILPQIFAEGVTLDPSATSVDHRAHFRDAGRALDAMGQLNAAIASQFATYPLGSSSGAFTFGIDPESGAYVPTSDSLGPIFTERTQTLGKNKFSYGFTSLFYEFDTLDGLDLGNGDLVFNLVHADSDGDGTLDPGFEGDLVTSRVFLGLSLDTTVLFANFGVTDRLDLGIAVPYVQADMDVAVRSTVLPLATGSDGTHVFPNKQLVFQPPVTNATAEGLGDVVLRGKYNFAGAFAGNFDLRLPTGDEKDLLGSGATQLKMLLTAGGKRYDFLYGGLFPHMSVGYTLSDGGYSIALDADTVLQIEPPDEINYTFGFDTALGRRVTLALDVVGRLLLDTQEISVASREFFYTSILGPVESVTRPELITTNSDVSIILGTLGLKFNLGSTYVLSVGALAPLATDRGLEDELAFAVAMDYTF